jgi:integrase
MIKKVISSLGSILAEASLARNVVREHVQRSRKRERRVERRQTKRPEIGVDIPTKPEINAILHAAQEVAGGRWYPLVVTAIFTGLRASELRGLLWSEVDLEHRPATITVRQRADRWRKIGAPKSAAATREVPLVPEVVNTLKRWRLTCPRTPEGHLELVFPNSVGKIETLPSIHRRGLGPIQVRAGICGDKLHPKYGMHAFRHAAASLFIEQGLSPKRVQALMGHSTIAMTLDTYTHLWPSTAEDTAMLQRIQDGLRVVGS